LVLSVTIPQAERSERGGSIYDNTTRGIRIYLATPRLRGLLALNLSVVAAGAMVIVNTVVIVRGLLTGTDSDVAIALAFFGGGSMTAALLLPRLLDRMPDALLCCHRQDVFWSHRGELCTFDVMIEEFGLSTPPLDRLAIMVRAADTGRLNSRRKRRACWRRPSGCPACTMTISNSLKRECWSTTHSTDGAGTQQEKPTTGRPTRESPDMSDIPAGRHVLFQAKRTASVSAKRSAFG
jgi:hypothetical protein